MKTIAMRCMLRDIIKKIVVKKVISVDVHICLMNLSNEELKILHNLFLSNGVAKLKMLIIGEEYYQKDYGKRRYESAYQNFFIDFKTRKLV